METVKSINDIKANRALLNKINTNISTLKCYNFELEGDDVENSSFLIEIKEKVKKDGKVRGQRSEAPL